MKRHPLPAFFLMAFVISWTCWFLLPLSVQGRLSVSPRFLHSLGVFGPGLAALLVTARLGGIDGLRKIFQRLLIWRVRWVWYAAALLLPSVISLVTTALHVMFGGNAPRFSDPPIYHVPLEGFLGEYNGWTILLPIFLIHLVADTAIPEEVAWRGFVLPRVQRSFGAWISAAVIGISFALWLLPLSLISPAGFKLTPFLVVTLGAVANAIIATFLFNNTAGSLLLTVLFNNSLKVTDLFLASPSGVKPLTMLAGYWIVAGAILLLFRAESLTRGNIPQSALADDTETGTGVM